MNPLDVVVLMISAAAAIAVLVCRDLVALFVALEMVSACGWLLLWRDVKRCGVDRDKAATIAAAHVFSCLTGSALLIIGLAIIYALPAVATNAANGGSGILPRLAALLVFAGLGVRLGAIPFASHLPAACASASGFVTLTLLAAPFVAGWIALTRLSAVIAPNLAECRFYVVPAFLSALSIVAAGAAALRERNLRRLSAYMFIGQSGMVLAGLAAAFSPPAASPGSLLRDNALGSVLFNIFAVAPAAIGACGVLVYLGRRDGEINDVDELAGLGRCRPWTAAALAVFLFSLSGIPPLAGFWGRAAVLSSLLSAARGAEQWAAWCFIALACAVALNAVLTAVVCARLLAVVYFRMPLAVPVARAGRAAFAAIAACAALTIAIGPAGFRLSEESRRSAIGRLETINRAAGRTDHVNTTPQSNRTDPSAELDRAADIRARR